MESNATHQVIDMVYTEEEGNVDFSGTYQECWDYIEEQGDMAFTYRIVPIIHENL